MEAASRAQAGKLRPAGAEGLRLRSFTPGLAVLLAGLLPFLFAGLAWEREGGELAGAGLIGGCPMLEIVGIPCASCGAARAFYLLTHGDAAFLSYNWFWPLAAAFAVGWGAVLLERAARGAEPFGRLARSVGRRYATQPVRMAAITLAVLTLPWIVAFANLDAIRSA